MNYIVTGAAGFIGSHLTDRLVGDGHVVYAIDNFRSGFSHQVNPGVAKLMCCDITDFPDLLEHIGKLPAQAVDGIFHCAAIARTPWCIEDPLLAGMVNSQGTLHMLEIARRFKVSRVVLSSSNVVYAAHTAYRASKEMTELWGRVYHESYGLSVIALRYSNVYGKRQSEDGPSPNVFAALRKSKKENGRLEITGDGEQSRDFTHVSDIVQGQVAAMASSYCGVIDLCTGKNWTLNQVAKFFDCPVEYLPERAGDVKHIVQEPQPAADVLGWKALVELPEGIKDCL